MRPYITRIMEEAHEKGTPVMRPLFYDFPEDSISWECEDQYLFGSDVLVAPVMYAKTESRSVSARRRELDQLLDRRKAGGWTDGHSAVTPGSDPPLCQRSNPLVKKFIDLGEYIKST